MNKNKNNSISGKWILYVVLLLFLALQILLAIRLLDSIKPLKNNDSSIITKYSTSSEFIPKVKLKDNIPVNFENLDELDSYILEYVKGFDITSKFDYSSEDIANVTLDYTVSANVLAYYKQSIDATSNPKVWEKKETLLQNKVEFNSSKYSLILPISIDLEKYVTQIKEFNESVNLPIDGYIQINLNVKINGLKGEDNFSDNYDDTMKIPITSSVIKISTYSKEPSEKIVYYEDATAPSMKIIAVNIFLVLGNFICLLITLKGLFLQKKMTAYKKEITKILRNYDDVIITTSTSIKLSNYNVIEIKEFKELLNLSRESSVPIFYYEYEKEKISIFYILNDDNAYVYTLYEYDEKELSNREKNKLTN